MAFVAVAHVRSESIQRLRTPRYDCVQHTKQLIKQVSWCCRLCRPHCSQRIQHNRMHIHTHTHIPNTAQFVLSYYPIVRSNSDSSLLCICEEKEKKRVYFCVRFMQWARLFFPSNTLAAQSN